MKKPAAAMRTDEEPKKKNGGSMKRPAAIGSFNKSLEDLRGGLKKAKKSEDDEAEKSEHESGNEEDDQNRDKGKAIKFRQMQKELPPHIVDLYEKEANNKSSPVLFERTSSTSCSLSCPMVGTG